MRVKEFEREVVALTPFGATALDQRTRSLRDAGFLPVGAPGPNAPAIETLHAAAIVVSLVADVARDAALAVMAYDTLIRKGGKGELFTRALWRILEDPENRQGIAEVRLNKSWPQATVIKKNGQQIVYLPGNDASEKPGACVELVLKASTLTMLALALRNSAEAKDRKRARREAARSGRRSPKILATTP